jgi:hypothetical protein
MSVEEVLREVEKQLGELDERAKEAVKLALKLAQGEVTKVAEPVWQGENPPFEEMANLGIEERSRIMNELEERNREWLLRKCEELQASWLVVVDGKVLRHGYGWNDFVTDAEKLQIAQWTGKMPLLFIHPKMLWIEEVAWSFLGIRDAYPTLPFALMGNKQRVDLVGDFDTGATGIFTDAEMMSRNGVIQILPTDQWLVGFHLGTAFVYCTKSLTVALGADDGTERLERNFGVVCVFNWQKSPFVAVNPSRVALVGRDICLRLQPKIALDFANLITSLTF